MHRMPYMKMDPQKIWITERILFALVFALSLHDSIHFEFQQIYAAFIAPFNIFVFPGFFFYAANKERLEKNCKQCFQVYDEPAAQTEREKETTQYLSEKEKDTTSKSGLSKHSRSTRLESIFDVINHNHHDVPLQCRKS